MANDLYIAPSAHELDAKLVQEIGTGSVRVEIIENRYGICEVRPVHHCYSIIEGKTGTNDRFDICLISELIRLLEQAQSCFRPKSGQRESTPFLTNTDALHKAG